MPPPPPAALPRLAAEPNLWLATTRPGGRPHLVPIWFVFLDGTFYLVTGPDSVKARNLHANPACSVSLQDGAAPVIAECRARPLAPPYSQALVEAFQAKYDWDIRSDPVYNAAFALQPLRWLMAGG